MNIGPNGEKRPADVVGNAVMVAKIATGEIEEVLPDDRPPSGLSRALAEAAKLRAEQCSEPAHEQVR